MVSNVLEAINNIAIGKEVNLSRYPSDESRRILAVGKPLEAYSKDAFCNSFSATLERKTEIHRLHFSYSGSDSAPPDFMLKGGDAFEVKKLEGYGEIQLNSSRPRIFCFGQIHE
ncbi:MAG: NgoPII family restriction endonuclease [Candidatus Aenigmarchaeota archaeon]|nr:NgoPII family restriction endonuclease [Candidatus Aenigmarchaeota archaeon]